MEKPKITIIKGKDIIKDSDEFVRTVCSVFGIENIKEFEIAYLDFLETSVRNKKDEEEISYDFFELLDKFVQGYDLIENSKRDLEKILKRGK